MRPTPFGIIVILVIALALLARFAGMDSSTSAASALVHVTAR